MRTNLGCNRTILYLISYYVILYISSNQTIECEQSHFVEIFGFLCKCMVHVSLYGRALLKVKKRKNEYICTIETQLAIQHVCHIQSLHKNLLLEHNIKLQVIKSKKIFHVGLIFLLQIMSFIMKQTTTMINLLQPLQQCQKQYPTLHTTNFE